MKILVAALTKIAALMLVLALSAPAFAGTTTFQATPGSGGPFKFGTDGSSNLFGNGAICDGAACALLASVNAAGTPGTNGLAVQGLTGGVPIPAVLTQGGAALSVTNGIYFNLLQGNAVLSSGNPIFASLTGSTLPAFASTPTVNLGTIGGGATAANQQVTAAGTSAASAQGVQGVTGGVAMPVTPKTAAFTFAGCAVTTSSAQCLAGSTAVNHLQLQNTSASASIACNFGGTAILNSSAGSFMLSAQQSSLWGAPTSGVPSAALNCIGSGSATLYIEYN